MAAPKILQETDIPAMLARVRAGEKLLDIAKDYGVIKQSLSDFLIKHCEPDYRAAQEDCLEELVEHIAEELKAAKTMTDIAREREIGKVRMWQLERRYPHLYGARQIVQGDKEADPVQVQVIDYKDCK